MNASTRYKDYRISAVSTLDFNATYRSRVVITEVRKGRPMSQRFLDFEAFSTRAAADERAIQGGKHWIDNRLRAASAAFRDEFDTIV